MRRYITHLQALLIVCTIAALSQTASAQTSNEAMDPSDWIERLGDDSFAQRERAKQELLKLSDRRGLTILLNAAQHHSLLEIRESSKWLLEELALREYDHQLDLLSRPDAATEMIQLPLWKNYSSIAGTDYAARNLFSRIASDRAGLLIWMQHASERDRQKPRTDAEKATVEQVSALLDPYRMSATDVSLWAILFCSDCEVVDHGLPNLTLRVALALSQSGLGPRCASDADHVVLVRLIEHWLRCHPNVGTKRDRISISMRYDCQQFAYETSQQTLADPLAAPSDQTIAMLCVAVLHGGNAGEFQDSNLENLLISRLGDERTAHGWQLIASRKTRIRTQVRDVAMALLLRHHHVDPRSVGFSELQADPLLVFRDQSLGFADDKSRQKAYEIAEAKLSTFSGADK